MDFNTEQYGKRLRELRQLRGLTQEELAEALNISLDHMRKMEKGKRTCSIDLLVEIAAFFYVSTDYLLTGKTVNRAADRTKILTIIADLSEIAKSL
ncbi:MAG: helix-turn-helix domain-containing protein [Clostridiales bacterium]|nr:helix-turn-helix domain-containing protein [Lachnospiraceae bacterium]MCD8150089.1 helix-turn-helix domain-containing protein [Clostridiales bacterium]